VLERDRFKRDHPKRESRVKTKSQSVLGATISTEHALEHDRIRLTSTAINMLVKTKSYSVIASLPEAITL
jgi:hypothetical protein